jgi:hypothetical protein
VTTSDDDPIPGEGDPVATGAKGDGEWPSRTAPARGTAPGTDPARAEALADERADHTTEADPGLQAAVVDRSVYEDESEAAGSSSIARSEER